MNINILKDLIVKIFLKISKYFNVRRNKKTIISYHSFSNKTYEIFFELNVIDAKNIHRNY